MTPIGAQLDTLPRSLLLAVDFSEQKKQPRKVLKIDLKCRQKGQKENSKR